MKVFLRAPFNYDTDEVSLETGSANNEPSMTDQSFAEEVDINTIVKRFGLTGEMPQQVAMPTYADFEQTYDFHTAMVELRRAESEFMRLPANVRARFNNDPGSLVAFLENADNRKEAEELGLVVKSPGSGAVPPVEPEAKPQGSAGSS